MGIYIKNKLSREYFIDKHKQYRLYVYTPLISFASDNETPEINTFKKPCTARLFVFTSAD